MDRAGFEAWLPGVTARTGDGEQTEWDGILTIAFAPDGRCREHREWFSRRDLSWIEQALVWVRDRRVA